MYFTAQIALLLLAGEATKAPVPANLLNDPLGKLEYKLAGEWIGDDPFIGDITIKGIGTFERKNYGTDKLSWSGTWKVKWDALPPTLVLTADKSTDKELIGKMWEVRLTRLDEKELHYGDGREFSATFKRKTE